MRPTRNLRGRRVVAIARATVSDGVITLLRLQRLYQAPRTWQQAGIIIYSTLFVLPCFLIGFSLRSLLQFVWFAGFDTAFYVFRSQHVWHLHDQNLLPRLAVDIGVS